MTIADEALPLDDQAMMHTFILLCTHENTLLGLSRHSDRCCSIVLQICNLCQNFFVRVLPWFLKNTNNTVEIDFLATDLCSTLASLPMH